MDEKKVSVIIPCYNGARFLGEAIESILAQTYSAFEIIVIDDGSTDNSAEVTAGYPGVRYILQENQGVAMVRNTGLHASKGDYLVFLDQDDLLLPSALETSVKCLNDRPECGFTFGLCGLIAADGLALPSEKIQAANYQEHSDYIMQLSGQSLVPPGVAMYRRTVLESVGGFDSSMVPSEDYDMYLRISRSFPIYCHNQVIIKYRLHDENQSRSTGLALKAILRVLDGQRDFIRGNKTYEAAYRRGRKQWRKLFGRLLPFEVFRNLKARKLNAVAHGILLFLQHYPQGLVTFPIYLLFKLTRRFKSTQS